METVSALSANWASVFPSAKPGTKQSGKVSIDSSGFRYSPETQAFDFCRLFGRLSLKRATGIEPALEAWKAPVQPQHLAREVLL
jgi:hypothetical protein